MNPRHNRLLASVVLLTAVVLWPLAHLTGWIHSVTFVNELSLAALVLTGVVWVVETHLDVKREEEDVAGEVVEKMKDDPEVPTT